MWYPGSGVILDCIDSLIFAAFLTMKMKLTCTSYSIILGGGGILIEHTKFLVLMYVKYENAFTF